MMDIDYAIGMINLDQERENMNTEQALENAVVEYKELAGQIKGLEAAQKAVKQTISDIFVELGIDKAETVAGKIYVSAPALIVSYDTKALDALAASDDTIKRLLWPHRKETERAGSLTIR